MKSRLLKKSMALLVGTLLVASFAGCGNQKEASEEAAEAVTEAMEDLEEATAKDSKNAIDISEASFVNEGKLTVGMVIDYPPFEYYPTNGDTPIGVDVDIITAVAGQLGLELDIKNVPWDDNLFTNMGSEYDVVCSAVTITDDRLKEMIFSDSYIDNYQSIVVRSDCDIAIDSFERLDGLKVAVQKDTVSDELMNSLIDNETINVQLLENEVATDCFDQLNAKEIDAIVCDSTVAEGQVARSSGAFVEAYRDASNVEKFAIAIGKDNQGLQKAINEALAILDDSGVEKTIINSWFSR